MLLEGPTQAAELGALTAEGPAAEQSSHALEPGEIQEEFDGRALFTVTPSSLFFADRIRSACGALLHPHSPWMLCSGRSMGSHHAHGHVVALGRGKCSGRLDLNFCR